MYCVSVLHVLTKWSLLSPLWGRYCYYLSITDKDSFLGPSKAIEQNQKANRYSLFEGCALNHSTVKWRAGIVNSNIFRSQAWWHKWGRHKMEARKETRGLWQTREYSSQSGPYVTVTGCSRQRETDRQTERDKERSGACTSNLCSLWNSKVDMTIGSGVPLAVRVQMSFFICPSLYCLIIVVSMGELNWDHKWNTFMQRLAHSWTQYILAITQSSLLHLFLGWLSLVLDIISHNPTWQS